MLNKTSASKRRRMSKSHARNSHKRGTKIIQNVRKWMSMKEVILSLCGLIVMLCVFERLNNSLNPQNDQIKNKQTIIPNTKENDESLGISKIIQNNEKANDNEQIKDLYLTESNRPRPPKSIHIDELSTNKVEKFWESRTDEMNFSNLPSANSNGKVYVMNYIFNPYEQMMSIFLLTSGLFHSLMHTQYHKLIYAAYLNQSGSDVRTWPSKKRRKDLPDLYRNFPDTIYQDHKKVSPEFACVFRKNDHLWISKVDFVPNNTTNDFTIEVDILRCHVPMAEISALYEHEKTPFFDADFKFEFLLSQRWKSLVDASNEIEINSDLVHISLSFLMGMRSGIKLFGNDDAFLLNKADQSRHFTLCMPPISDPLSSISEHVAHYISNIGVEHIYIGTFFAWDKAERDRERLIKRIKPWFDKGLVTVWPNEQPWIGFGDKAKGHWLNQCLYYAKSRDAFTLALDIDEFLVLSGVESTFHKFNENPDGNVIDSNLSNERAKMMQSVMINVLKNKISEFGDDHFCWLTFESYHMWQLLNENENFMLRRFVGRAGKAQMTWSKVIWNNKHLHFVGYHAGGACSAQGRDWTQIVNDWRDKKDEQFVYRFDPIKEGAVFHYYNNMNIRIEPKDKNRRTPWSATVNDTRMIDVYWPNIKQEFDAGGLDPTYPDDQSDVMMTDYYKQHYGVGNNMAVWREKVQKK